MKIPEIDGAWLTVNRFCNFRCRWCYAEGNGYQRGSNMSLFKAEELVDLILSLGIDNVIIIGGEPSFWPHLEKICQRLSENGKTTTLVTNGFLLSKPRFISKFSGLENLQFFISLKAGNSDQYQELTGIDSLHVIKRGMRNLNKIGRKFFVSITVNSLILDNLEEIVGLGVDSGAEGISIDFCIPTFDGVEPKRGFAINPRELVAAIVDKYPKIDRLTSGKFVISQSLPICIWPDGFLTEMEKKGQVSYGCQLLSNNGLIFDHEGYIIPCNCLGDIKLGQAGKDFHNAETFTRFWVSEKIREFFDQIISYPSLYCIECNDYQKCGGGCPLQWFVWDPQEVIQIKSKC